MRGVVDLEVAIKGGERDLHSGVNGGLLPAARRMAWRMAWGPVGCGFEEDFCINDGFQ